MNFNLSAVCAVNAVCTVCALGLNTGIGGTDPPIAVFAHKRSLAVGSVSSVRSVYAVGAFKSRQIIKIKPNGIADIAPLKFIFVDAEFRRFAVLPVFAVTSRRAFDVGESNEVLPFLTLIAPLYMRIGLLNFNGFAVCAVLAVGSVYTVLTVNSVSTVFSVNSVGTVFSVNPLVPSLPSIPFIPSLPSAPLAPSLPSAPFIPSFPSAPLAPSLPSIPLAPSLPSAPFIPSYCRYRPFAVGSVKLR